MNSFDVACLHGGPICLDRVDDANCDDWYWSPIGRRGVVTSRTETKRGIVAVFELSLANFLSIIISLPIKTLLCKQYNIHCKTIFYMLYILGSTTPVPSFNTRVHHWPMNATLFACTSTPLLESPRCAWCSRPRCAHQRRGSRRCH